MKLVEVPRAPLAYCPSGGRFRPSRPTLSRRPELRRHGRTQIPLARSHWALAVVAAVAFGTALPALVEGEAAADEQIPRTAWGAPDLGGVWDFRTATPLERSLDLGEQAFLSDEEAAEYEAQRAGRLDMDRRDGGADRDVSRAYNDFWWDFGDELTDNRTSLIVDPSNGRLPSLTPEAQARVADRRMRRTRPAHGTAP